MMDKLKCKLGKHDWFTETDPKGRPFYRQCQCCGRFEQPIISNVQIAWAIIEPDTITAKVLKAQNQIFNHINAPV